MNDAWMEGFEKLGVWVHCVVVVEASRRRLGWGMGGTGCGDFRNDCETRLWILASRDS